MKQIIALLMAGTFLAGCSNSGDLYLGKWQNVKYDDMSIEITKHDGGRATH